MNDWTLTYTVEVDDREALEATIPRGVTPADRATASDCDLAVWGVMWAATLCGWAFVAGSAWRDGDSIIVTLSGPHPTFDQAEGIDRAVGIAGLAWSRATLLPTSEALEWGRL